VAFEYIVDRESKFGTIVFDNINLHEFPQPRQDDWKSRLDEVGIVNKHRLVKIQRTATIVYRLRTWLDENGYGDNWEVLIPENSKYAVETCNSLLEADKLLTFNDALFLLLGLNTVALTLSPFAKIDLNNHEQSSQLNTGLNNIFLKTSEFNALQNSAYLINGRINGLNLVTMAEKNGFFTKQDERLNKRTLNEDVAIKLHKLLTNANCISGGFKHMWTWHRQRNQLSYLATRLKQKRVLDNNCHQELSNYIKDPRPHTKKPLADIEDPSDKRKTDINTIVEQLTS
jgi:hypothetical protein